MFGGITLREKIILGLLALLLLAGAAWRIWLPPWPATPAAIMPVAEDVEVEAAPELITVHVVGAVKLPGVYHIPTGSRVHHLIDLAGGPADEADLETVNLARPLFDGEQVKIYRYGENPEPGPGTASGKININRATAAELETLSGIGPVRAKSIVDHRDKHGYFKDITEIMDVKGIGEGTFNNIKDLITVY